MGERAGDPLSHQPVHLGFRRRLLCVQLAIGSTSVLSVGGLSASFFDSLGGVGRTTNATTSPHTSTTRPPIITRFRVRAILEFPDGNNETGDRKRQRRSQEILLAPLAPAPRAT